LVAEPHHARQKTAVGVGGDFVCSNCSPLDWARTGLERISIFPEHCAADGSRLESANRDHQGQADFARSFARIPELTGAYANGWNWLRPWFREMLTEREGFVIPLVFALVGGVTGIIRMARDKRAVVPRWMWLLVPSMASLIFWFLEAPALRFGEPAIWTAGATLGILAAVHWLKRPATTRIAVVGLVLLTAWAAHPRLFWNSYFRPSVGVRAFLRLPEATVKPHQSISGLIVNVRGDESMLGCSAAVFSQFPMAS